MLEPDHSFYLLICGCSNTSYSDCWLAGSCGFSWLASCDSLGWAILNQIGQEKSFTSTAVMALDMASKEKEMSKIGKWCAESLMEISKNLQTHQVYSRWRGCCISSLCLPSRQVGPLDLNTGSSTFLRGTVIRKGNLHVYLDRADCRVPDIWGHVKVQWQHRAMTKINDA